MIESLSLSCLSLHGYHFMSWLVKKIIIFYKTMLGSYLFLVLGQETMKKYNNLPMKYIFPLH